MKGEINMKKFICILLVVVFVCLPAGCSGKQKETSEMTETTEDPFETSSAIIKSKCDEWGIEKGTARIETDSSIYVDWRSGDEILELSYKCAFQEEFAKDWFDQSLYGTDNPCKYIPNGYHDSEAIEELDKEPRRQILPGYDSNTGTPDLWVLVQNGREYFFLYGKGEEQVKRVEELSRELNIYIK